MLVLTTSEIAFVLPKNSEPLNAFPESPHSVAEIVASIFAARSRDVGVGAHDGNAARVEHAEESRFAHDPPASAASAPRNLMICV